MPGDLTTRRIDSLRDFEVKQVQKFLYGFDLLSMEAFDLSEESGFDGSTSAFELIRKWETSLRKQVVS